MKANEPPFSIEGFGTAFKHVAFGFVDPAQLPWQLDPPGGTGTIQGQLVFNHFSRPPITQGFFAGPPVEECWIGLNDLTAVNKDLIAVPCDANSNFTIANVPPGMYQLVWWDVPLDALFGFQTIIVPPEGGMVDLGKVLAYRWFGSLEGKVCYDADGNGFCDPTEAGIPEQAVNIRFRDGTIYQATVTDPMGEYGFTEVFPFFKWLVTEVDFMRYKATGMTTAVDYGGAIPAADGWITPSFDKLNPQPQLEINLNTGNNLSRTETGPVLTQAMHLFLNQTNIIDWGKSVYGSGENGGVSGIVYYATTRAEDDPRFAAAETWEPGIPRVQVNLYYDTDGDGFIDDLDGDGFDTLADVDNYPLGNFPGAEDIDWNGDGLFDYGDAIQIAWTDSWDDNPPSGCIQDMPADRPYKECFDNFGTWNQVRPGVFDGGYAFTSYFPFGMANVFPGETELEGLPPGTYIVETVPPEGYEIQKEEDKNVLFGETYTPSPLLLPPVCVGDPHFVPRNLTLFPDVNVPFSTQVRPLCNRKQVQVADGRNTAADFFFFTEVPKAARAVGFVNNDLTAEFNVDSPIFGEKAAPSWIPVFFQDFTGREIVRTYTDEFGSYNALLPSTFTVNIASPSGVSPNMITIVLNHPFLPDGTKDPYYDPNYSVTPWTLDFWPGKTTYLDTPLVPVAAFANYPKGGVDVEPADGTPVISAVNELNGGPIVCAAGAGETLTVTSLGATLVTNPDYNPADPNSQPLITRDYSFGQIPGDVKVNGMALNIIDWSAGMVTASVPLGVETGQLVLTRGDNNRSTDIGITLHIGGCESVIYVFPSPDLLATPIQDAIDAADQGDLILVAPGTYSENPIMWKNVKLQGAGAGSTIISANPRPAERLLAWHAKIQQILGDVGRQFLAKEAPGIMILGNAGLDFTQTQPALIDGFIITGALSGGGIYVNSDAHYLTISNNRVMGNQGIYSGGITLGTPDTGLNAANTNITIRNNRIVRNGAIRGGGGVSIYAGADNYILRDNFISGNFSRWNGGGIAHYGLSPGGLIADNAILFNEIFYGGPIGGDGGGIFIGGEAVAGELGAGSGSVTINSNLIQGNLAGSGSGGGIRALSINGQDVLLSPEAPDSWYRLNIFNNIIVNNVAALAGGGIALQDAAKVNIINNTIANNDSTSTAAAAFTPGTLNSTPYGAGIVSGAHGLALSAANGQTFSDPLLVNNIIWHNRSFYNDAALNGGRGGLSPNPDNPYWDLQVMGTATPQNLNPQYSILSDTTSYDATNRAADPLFVNEYVNNLLTAAVLDEGGNFISVRYTPVRHSGDYHIQIDSPSPAIDGGTDAYLASFPELAADYDKEPRPAGAAVDIGADELGKAQYLLAITLAGTGAGSVAISPGGVVCNASCSQLYDAGITVQLTAIPSNSGTVFGGWSGAITSTSSTVSLTMDGDRAVTATFTSPSITVTSPAAGDVWRWRTIQTISWTYTGNPGPNVRIQLLKGNRVYRYISWGTSIGTGGAGSYNWFIPAGLPAANDYRIRVISLTNFAWNGTSDPFTINNDRQLMPRMFSRRWR